MSLGGMTRLECQSFALLVCLSVTGVLSSEPLTYSINTKKWSHILDDHFISVTINPTDLLQGKAFGLGMNSTLAILKGLSPAYIRIGSADTGKYTFKRSRYPSDAARTDDEFIITESHWTIFNDVVRSAGLDVIVCLNAAHRNGATRKWDTRNSLELISFSDSKGYNLTFQLGYEVHRSSGISGHQYGKDLNRLRTILNAFPRYQNSKLIGPDIRVVSKREDIDFVNDVLFEAGSILDAITWHPRWPQPSKMKVSDISELGYEFPTDYIEWDKNHLSRMLQRSIFKNPIWIGEPKTESTGTFAEGLLWARRLILAAKLGIEVVMKQPSLMDISHPKPEYWIAFLHKRLLGRAVLETKAVNNQTEISAITHCTNSLFWSQRPNKALDGAVTVYAVNMGGKEQKVHLKGPWSGKPQIMLQYLLTSGSDPDSVFSQMTYLNGEPLMMTDDGNLPDTVPKIRRMERGVLFKLPPYSVGFWVLPEARVKICQSQPTATSNFQNLQTANAVKTEQRSIPNARALNQLIVDKLKNPVSESDEEIYDDTFSVVDSGERDLIRESLESPLQRPSRRVREITVEDIGQELKDKIREIREMLENKGAEINKNLESSEVLRAAEEKITSLTNELGAATRLTNQQEEFGRFLHQSGLNQNFGALMVNDRTGMQGLRRSIYEKTPWAAMHRTPSAGFDPMDAKIRRFRRSLSYPEDDYEEESTESYSSQEEDDTEIRPNRKINYRKRLSRLHEDSDESGDNSSYSGTPALNGLDDNYRNIYSYRAQDENNKLGDIRRQKKKESEEPKKPEGKKANTLNSDLQEEILMKEVEVLEKTEEAMANLIKNHKKRAETIEEIILHEISDIKEDRLSALQDIRNHKEVTQMVSKELGDVAEENEILPKVRRNVLDMLNKNSDSKTKRSIETDSHANGLPEDSHEEKKSKIVKRSADSSYEKLYKRRRYRKNHGDDNSNEKGNRHVRKSRSERLERMKNFIQSRERIRDRNVFRRKHNRYHRKHKADGDEESNEISIFSPDMSEDMVIKEIQKEILKKPDRRNDMKETESEKTSNNEGVRAVKKEDSRNEKNNDADRKSNGGATSYDNENDTKKVRQNEDEEKKSKSEEKKQGSNQDIKANVKKVKSEEQVEYIPLKIDKNRGLNVLKRISNLVETINTREKSKSKRPSVDVEDLSDEFYGDAISKITKRRHRRSHYREGEEAEDLEADDGKKDPKTLRQEIKLRRILNRINKTKKSSEENSDSERPKSRLQARLEARLAKLTTTDPTVTTSEPVRVTEKSHAEETTLAATAAKLSESVSSTETSISEAEDMKMQSDANHSPEDDTKLQAEPTTEKPSKENVTEKETRAKQPADLKNEPDSNGDEKVENSQDKVKEKDSKEVSITTEATIFTTTDLDASYEDSLEAHVGDHSDIEESTDTPRTILLFPEEGGLVYNPVIVANPSDNYESEREAEYMSEEDTDGASQLMNLEPYVMKDMPPLDPDFSHSSEERYSHPELPDLITELMEGESRPWTGKSIQDDDGNATYKKRNSKRGEPIKNGKLLLPREVEMPVEADVMNPSGKENSEEEPRKFSSVSEIHISQIPEGKESQVGDTPDEEKISKHSMQDETEKEDGKQIKEEVPSTLNRRKRGILEREFLTPEERIRNFKRIVHRRQSPFSHRNELPISVEGDNFWKMAGSTMKAVFNDVIPEAYGKTKNKIENLGIAEYFKEFGKIVEQMKNLDKLFANIGQAAVRNYIKGTEDEKGDYIQIIEKKHRSRRDVEGQTYVPATEDDTLKETEAAASEDSTTSSTQEIAITENTEKTPVIPANKIKAHGTKKNAKERPNDLIRDIFLLDSNPGIVEVTKSTPTTEATPAISLQPFEPRYSVVPKTNHVHGRLLHQRDNALRSRPYSEAEIQSMGVSKFAPWMKTTKDFINQALTTLQRQRELSEMIARESVNDLVKREIERKVIGKRETNEDRRMFPVYQMPSNRKREVYSKAEDPATKYLSQLQPGVYIVPTDEMKNLRSEQIMKEAPPTKPGMPNMVTLNIYYDKKTTQEWDSKELAKPREYTEYYNVPSLSWNPVPIADPAGNYVPPLHDAVIESSYLPPMHDIPPIRPEPPFQHPRVVHYPEQFTEWVPTHSYPPRSQNTYYYPSEMPVAQVKNDWADYRTNHAVTPDARNNRDSGWAVQFQTTKKKPSRVREPLRPSLDRLPRTFPEKKRSVGNGMTGPNFPGLALPFWKFLGPKKDEKTESATKDEDSSDSIEELFAENRKRARLNEAKKQDAVDVTKKPEDAEEEKIDSRKRRDTVAVEFRDHDLIPEWFGTIQESDNMLHDSDDLPAREIKGVPPSHKEIDVSNRSKRDIDDPKPVLKSLTGEDSSLEVPGSKSQELEHMKSDEDGEKGPAEVNSAIQKDGSDDVLTHFFRYAYESLIDMMKGMTGFI